MKLLQLGIASLPFIDACVSFNAEERTHFTDTIGALLILAPHLSQFMTTFTVGEVNLEPTPRRGIRRCRPRCRCPGPGPTSVRTTSITQLDRRRQRPMSLWAESCRCAATVGRQDLRRPPLRSATSAWRKRRDKAALSSGCKPHPATAPAGSNRSSHGGDEMAEAS
jgi:hypothetical protein